MDQREFEAIMNDATKRIDGTIDWGDDEDHSPALEFKAKVESDAGWPILVKGSYNPKIGALSYTIIHRGAGRICALDLGKDHHNPTCQNVGEKHRHNWTNEFRDKVADAALHITASASDPIEVWKQFCADCKIMHNGMMHPPTRPAEQRDFFE